MSTNMELITSVTVGSGGTSSVTLPATGTIPATYTDLYVLLSARSNRSADSDPINLELNGSTANDTSRYIEGDGSSVSSGTAGGTQTEISRVPAANATANTFGNASIYIPNYASSNNKSSSGDAVTENNGTTAFTKLTAGLWSDSTAVTTIRLVSQTGNNFVQGSTFYLYGISNVTSTTKATGGIVSSDGIYNYHMFPYSGTFTPTENITADYLVIAGGGGGGHQQGGGGGGAGGLRSTVGATGGGGSLESALSLTANTAYTVTIGAGGALGTSSARGTSGGNSVFSTITSTGGGGGGSYNVSGQDTGATGGSGGGGTYLNKAGGAGTSNQGYAGANGASSATVSGGGGGGAGAAGTKPAQGTNTKGNGGNGVQITAFANATQTGANNGYYAGGGGGGSETLEGGDGGLGGGGKGAFSGSSNGTAGAVNTGSGGGGSYISETGGAGGSGLVIIRYAI